MAKCGNAADGLRQVFNNAEWEVLPLDIASYSNLIKHVRISPCKLLQFIKTLKQKASLIFLHYLLYYEKCSWKMNVENKPVQTCVLEPEWRVCVVTTAAKYWNHWGRFFLFFLTAVRVVCAPERWTWTPRRGKRLDVIFSVLNGFSVSLKEPRILPRLSNGSASIYKACEIFFHVLILP